MGGSGPWARPGRDVIAVLAGLSVLGAGMLVVRHGEVSGIEEWCFRRVNELPDALYPLVWPFQQIGVLAVGPVVAIVALVLHHRRLALAALIVTVLKLGSERAVKAFVSRQRPGTSIGPDITRRGDVHLAGESFVSGHAVLVAALAGVIAPYLPGRWRAVPWAFVVAVMFARVYVGAHNPLDVVCGAALGVAIAGAVRLVLRVAWPAPETDPDAPVASDAIAPIRSDRSARAALLALIAMTPAPGHAAAADPASTLADDVVTVASFDFAESRLLAEIYSQALETAGFDVQRAYGLGPREFVAPALASGLVEVVPEYAGTAAEFYSLGAAEPGDDVAATHDQLVAALADEPIVALAPAPAQDANTFVVTRATAERFGVSTLSDLGPVAASLTLGGPPECPNRRLCLGGLTDVYGLTFGEFLPLDAGGPLTVQALEQGQIDVALLFTTDPLLDDLDLVELADDRGLQPAENLTPLIRRELVDRWGEDITSVVDATSERLTTSGVRDLNRQLLRDRADVATVAAAWWREVGDS